jgi:response regulator RpfG family c-di-GMP phosphodiesterase
MDDDQAIGDIVCAAYLSHLGQTQVDFEYSHIPQLKMNGLQQKEFRKHPALSQHLIRKSGLLISERCNQLIVQHHERFDGNGYPDKKKGDHIEPLALVLGAASHILEFQTGRVTGTEVSMRAIINCFKNDAPMTGLEVEFGKVIYDNLLNMFEDENLSEAEGSSSDTEETKQAA